MLIFIVTVCYFFIKKTENCVNYVQAIIDELSEKIDWMGRLQGISCIVVRKVPNSVWKSLLIGPFTHSFYSFQRMFFIHSSYLSCLSCAVRLLMCDEILSVVIPVASVFSTYNYKVSYTHEPLLFTIQQTTKYNSSLIY